VMKCQEFFGFLPSVKVRKNLAEYCLPDSIHHNLAVSDPHNRK